MSLVKQIFLIYFLLWGMLLGFIFWQFQKDHQIAFNESVQDELDLTIQNDVEWVHQFSKLRNHEINMLKGLRAWLRESSLTPQERDRLRTIFQDLLRGALELKYFEKFQWIDPLQNVLLEAKIDEEKLIFTTNSPIMDEDYAEFLETLQDSEVTANDLNDTLHVKDLITEDQQDQKLAYFKIIYIYTIKNMKNIGGWVLTYSVPKTALIFHNHHENWVSGFPFADKIPLEVKKQNTTFKDDVRNLKEDLFVLQRSAKEENELENLVISYNDTIPIYFKHRSAKLDGQNVQHPVLIKKIISILSAAVVLSLIFLGFIYWKFKSFQRLTLNIELASQFPQSSIPEIALSERSELGRLQNAFLILYRNFNERLQMLSANPVSLKSDEEANETSEPEDQKNKENKTLLEQSKWN